MNEDHIELSRLNSECPGNHNADVSDIDNNLFYENHLTINQSHVQAGTNSRLSPHSHLIEIDPSFQESEPNIGHNSSIQSGIGEQVRNMWAHDSDSISSSFSMLISQPSIEENVPILSRGILPRLRLTPLMAAIGFYIRLSMAILLFFYSIYKVIESLGNGDACNNEKSPDGKKLTEGCSLNE